MQTKPRARSRSISPERADLDTDFGDAGQLFESARRLLTRRDLIDRLSLAPASYREARPREVSAEGVSRLRAILTECADARADARPLAAIVTAELGATHLLDAVVAITTSPHPLVAAVARAAAIRLGAPMRRVGSLQELADFLRIRSGGELTLA